ncbi:ribonuclease H-like domain-containing protein [Tanacetum coccineum]
MTAKRNQESVKSILLLAIPDEYLFKFHNVPDARSLWAAIKSRFGGNDESKKMQMNVLKHQFENFTTAPNESLDKAYDRFQKLISQLEVHAAPVSREDINQKFLRSLPPSWSQIALIMRNKPDIDQTDIDDLYNNLRVYEDEMKRSSSSISTSQNMAFISSENTSSTNEVSTASGDFRVSTAEGISQVSTTSCAHDVAYSFFAQPNNHSQLEMRIFIRIDERTTDWKNWILEAGVAYVDIRVKKFLQKTEELGFPRKNGLFLLISQKLSATTVTEKGTLLGNADLEGIKGEDLMNYDSEREKHSRARLEIQGNKLALESLESRILGHEKNELAWGEKYESSDKESTPTNDRFSKADGYHDVPLPITGNFLTPRADISFAGLDEYAIRKKIIESKTTELNVDTSKSKTSETVVSPVKTNETQTAKTQVDKIGQTSKKAGIGFKKIKACFGKKDITLKKSRWVWRPKGNYFDHVSKDSGYFMLKKVEYVDPKGISKSVMAWWFATSHMTGNKALSFQNYEDYNEALWLLEGIPKEGKITDKSFKLLDESQVVHRAPRKEDVYSLDLKNIVPSGGLENQLNHNVKIIRCDNGTEFKNHAMNEFYAKKGIKREFSVARTPQQNGVAERKNRTLIEAARTIKKSFRVYNKRNKMVEENLHINFLEDQPNMAGTGPNWMFDLDFLTNTMNYIPVSVENQVNVDVGTQDSYVAGL